MKDKCTWQGCAQPASHDQLDSTKSVWARLCQKHHDDLDSALEKGGKSVVRAWIKAKGGPARAAKSMTQTPEGE